MDLVSGYLNPFRERKKFETKKMKKRIGLLGKKTKTKTKTTAWYAACFQESGRSCHTQRGKYYFHCLAVAATPLREKISFELSGGALVNNRSCHTQRESIICIVWFCIVWLCVCSYSALTLVYIHLFLSVCMCQPRLHECRCRETALKLQKLK